MRASLRSLGCALFLAWLGASPAAAIVCGESVSGTIGALGEIDSYTIQAAAGDVISVSLGGANRFSAFGVAAELRNPSNQNVTFRDIYNQQGNSILCQPHTTCETRNPLSVSGTYTLRIYDFGGNATGDYSFTVDTVGGTWNGGSNAPPSPVCGAVADGTSTIACGETVSGNLDVYGDADTYTFLASAGDVVAFSVSRPPASTVNPVVELFAPGGALVPFYDGTGNYCEYVSCVADPLPATGVYTVKFTDSGITHLGPYSFTLESVAGSFGGASNGPPAPTCGAAADGARAIACGERLTGTIAVEGDSDAFTFFADAGESVALVLEQPAGSALVPMAELYAPDGSFLARAEGPPFPAVEPSGPLPASGVYTVKVTDFAIGEALDQTGPYALSLVASQLDGASCGAFLQCGATVSATAALGEADLYRFAAEAGDVVRLHAAGTALPQLTLLAPDLAPASLTAPLPQSGVYTLQVVAGAAGSYGLTLEAVSGSLNGGGNAWPPLVCGNAVADGTQSIACGQTLAGAIGSAGDSDTYTFLAEAGEIVSVAVNDAVGGFDPVAELFGPDGASLLLSGESLCGPNESCTTAPLAAAGAYTIRVRPPTGSATGAYTVQLGRSPCASECQDGIDNDADGLVDYPSDLGCANAGDLSERRECNDGFDNDGDGLTDFAGGDLGCPTNNSTIEDAQCDDGRDNDADGGIDADGGGTGTADAYCAGVSSNSIEAPPASSPACGIGPELLALGLLLARWRRAR